MRALPGPGRPEQRGRSSGRVLVLNASFEPINVCTVRRAAVLILKNRAEVLEHGEWALHAESLSLPRPVVIRLLTYVRIPRDAHRRKITRRAVFARDRWTCQYCGHERGNLTVDHVIPRSKGGSSSWDNIVTCCAPCNRRKGDRLPRQANMVPGAASRARPAPPSSSTSRPRASLRRGSSTWWPPDGPLAPRRPPARPAGSAVPSSGAAGAAARHPRADPSARSRRREHPPARPAAGRAARPGRRRSPPRPPPAPRAGPPAPPRARAAAAVGAPAHACRRPAPGRAAGTADGARRPATARRAPAPPPATAATTRPGHAGRAAQPAPLARRGRRLGRGRHRDRGARVHHRERRRRAAARRDEQPGASIQRRVNRQVEQLETRLEQLPQTSSISGLERN